MFVGLIDIVWSALEDQISSQSNQLTASSSSVQDIDTWLECMIQTVDGISSLSGNKTNNNLYYISVITII
jgi:hypothetical protein